MVLLVAELSDGVAGRKKFRHVKRQVPVAGIVAAGADSGGQKKPKPRAPGRRAAGLCREADRPSEEAWLAAWSARSARPIGARCADSAANRGSVSAGRLKAGRRKKQARLAARAVSPAGDLAGPHGRPARLSRSVSGAFWNASLRARSGAERRSGRGKEQAGKMSRNDDENSGAPAVRPCGSERPA